MSERNGLKSIGLKSIVWKGGSVRPKWGATETVCAVRFPKQVPKAATAAQQRAAAGEAQLLEDLARREGLVQRREHVRAEGILGQVQDPKARDLRRSGEQERKGKATATTAHVGVREGRWGKRGRWGGWTK